MDSSMFVCFFFQAEDGIRDLYVTGVQRVLFRSLPMNRWASEPISRFNRSFCCRVSADAATRRHCTTYPRKRPALMTGTATPYTIESPTARKDRKSVV